ncbi:MAG: hypothetical protein ACI33S_04885 [Bacilli bacterium]
MYKYLKIFNKGFEEGVMQAFEDLKNDRTKDFKSIDDIEIKSKMYDIGFIKGYKKFTYKNKNNLLFDRKL